MTTGAPASRAAAATARAAASDTPGSNGRPGRQMTSVPVHPSSDFLIPIRNRSCFSEKGLALFSTHR
ncbi:MAG: hypothetical protein ABIF71_06895 [Planctomycetota bacterium]